MVTEAVRKVLRRERIREVNTRKTKIIRFRKGGEKGGKIKWKGIELERKKYRK